jgi:hypothetical protein
VQLNPSATRSLRLTLLPLNGSLWVPVPLTVIFASIAKKQYDLMSKGGRASPGQTMKQCA